MDELEQGEHRKQLDGRVDLEVYRRLGMAC